MKPQTADDSSNVWCLLTLQAEALSASSSSSTITWVSIWDSKENWLVNTVSHSVQLNFCWARRSGLGSLTSGRTGTACRAYFINDPIVKGSTTACKTIYRTFWYVNSTFTHKSELLFTHTSIHTYMRVINYPLTFFNIYIPEIILQSDPKFWLNEDIKRNWHMKKKHITQDCPSWAAF